MKRRAFLGAMAIASLGADKARSKSRFEPPDGKVLVFIGNYEPDSIDSYRRVVSHEPTGVKFLWDWDQRDGFFNHQCEKAGPNAPLLINFTFVRDWVDGNPRKAISEIPRMLAGEWDAGINNVGKCFKESGRPIFAMIGNEFNLAQTYTPDEYIKCWRYVHDRWESLGATNVAYVWNVCPQITERPYADFYPGQKYVDWISSSYYGTGSNLLTVKALGNPDRGLKEIVGLSRHHKKPFMLGECGPYGGPRQSWRDWYEPFFQFVKWSGAKAFTFNNQPVLPESPAFGDERMEAMAADVQKRWAEEMGKSRYLKPTPQLYDQIGFAGRIDATKQSPGLALLNGKDLSGWTAQFKNGDGQADDEFSMSSTGILSLRARHEGYLKTEKPYQDFVLTFDWRFPRGGKQSGSGSGVLLGLGEEDGWLSHGFEVQIASRNCGDLWVYDGYRFDGQATEGRFGRVQKKVGAEKPIGEWNSYEIRCEGRKIKITLNGRLVNEATSDRIIKGRIGIISQGTEVEFRGLRLTPVGK